MVFVEKTRVLVEGRWVLKRMLLPVFVGLAKKYKNLYWKWPQHIIYDERGKHFYKLTIKQRCIRFLNSSLEKNTRQNGERITFKSLFDEREYHSVVSPHKKSKNNSAYCGYWVLWKWYKSESVHEMNPTNTTPTKMWFMLSLNGTLCEVCQYHQHRSCI